MDITRVIARLDLKDDNVVKGYQLEGLRVLGDALSFANKYYARGADEIFLNDVVASLFGRKSLLETISKITDSIHIPVTVCGGIRSLDDVNKLMHAGADRVAINSAAIARPQLIREIADRYGSQAVSVSIEAKQTTKGVWKAFFDSGRESSDLDVFDWISTCEIMKAGEIILTSVDRDGTLKGPDSALIEKACSMTRIPLVVSGGFSKVSQVEQLRKTVHLDGIAIGKAFHLNQLSINEVKSLFLGKVSW